MSVLENHVSLTLPFRTSGSSLASDLSAELAELEANGVAPPVHVSHTVAKQRLLSSIQGEGSKVWAGMSKARAGGVVAGGAENHMDGNWAPEPEIGRRSLRHPNQTASVNWGGQESTRKAGMNGNPEMGNEEVTLRGVQSKIIRTKAALTEFLEELGLKEESANGAGNNVASWEDGEALSRGANLVRMLTVCVEEHGKLTAQLQLIRTEQGADCTDESAAESGSKRGGEGQAGSDLSFSNLVRRPGTAKGAAAGMQPMSGKGDEVQFEVGPAGRSGGAPEGDLMGLGVNPGSVDCSLSEDTDVVVMSDSEAEGPSEEGQLDREDVKGLGSNNRKTAACDEAKLCEQLLKVGEGMKNTAVYRGMGDSSAGAEKEECGREPAWGAEKASISERERWILTQLEQSEKRIQELQSEALADVAASHWALKNSAGETTEGGREGGGGDVADSDWPEETRAAATQFLQAMTAHLAGLFEEYHGLLAARWHDGRPSDGRQVAGAERVRLTGELKPEPSWDLLFSVEKLEVQAGGGALWAGPQTPPAGRVSGFELQSASATPGSEPQGYYDRAPNLDAGAVSYRYADIMLGASPESVACEGEPLRSVLSSPAGKNTRSAAAAFASWASAKPFFSDAGTQSELRELSDASVQCDLAPPVTRPLTVAQTGPKPTPLSSSPKASTDKFPSASLRYPPSQQPRPNPERRTISGRPALAPVSSNTLAVESPKQSPKVGRKRTSENRKVDVRRSPLEVRELGAREDKGIGGGDVLRRRCRTLECQVAALTGLLQAEKAERERLERWQGEMEKQTLRAPASLTPAPVASSGNVAPFPSSGLNSLPPEAVSLAAELACSRHTSTETRDGSTGVGEGSQGNDVTASMGDVRAEEWVVLGIGVDAEKKGPSAESSEREAGDLVRERRAVVHEPGCSEVDGGDGAGLEPGSSAADEQRLVEGEPGGSKLEAEYSVARELGKSEADRQRRMEKVVGSPKADGRRPVEGEPGSSEERRLGELLEVVERQDEELSKVREELNKVQEELRLRDEGGREGLEVQGEVRLQEGRTASGGERQTESGTERGAVSGTERGRENGTERRAAPRLRGDGATRGAERERSWPEMEGTERELNVIDKSCGTDLEGGLEEVGATGGAATERERTSGTAERWNGTNGAGVTVSNMGGHLDGSAAKGTSRASRTKGLGPEWDPQALEGLLAELESQQNVQCTMSFLLTLIRSCKALLAGEGRSDANGVGHRGEAKRVAGKAGKHQALLKVLEGAREQRWAAEAALRGLHVSAGAVEASTQGRILAQELSGTGPQGRNGFVQSKESHVAVVRLLTATMTEVARDVSVQTTGLADASTSEGLDGVLSASGDASGAKVGRSGEGLGGLPSGLSKNYGGVTGTGLYGVLDNVRKRAVGAETARELRKEVSDLCGVVGLEGEAGTTAVTRLLEATDAVIGCFYSSHGSGRNLGSQRNGERASETCLRSGEKLRGKTGVAAERQSELAMELTVRTELEELQELLDKLRREGDSLRRQSEEICAQASRAKQKAEREALEVQERAGKAKEKWEREALEREGEKGRAEKELQGLKGEVWKTEAELWKVKGEVLRVREELGSVEKELRRVVEERNVTVGETESLRKRVLSLKEDVKSAENEVESERERARESRKEALAAAEEAGKSREKLRALEELVQKATQTVDHLESDRKVLLERLRGTESALRRGEEEVLRVRQTVDETEGKLRELEDKERDMRGRMEGGRRDVDQLEQRVAELRSERESTERQLAVARAQLRELAVGRERPASGRNEAEWGRNGGTEEEAGAALEEKLASLQGELMDVKIHLLASRRECQAQEERALRASRDADVARDELALLKETALNARREAEEAQAQANAAGDALEAVKRRLEQMVSANPRGHKGDGVTQEGFLADVIERALGALGGGELSGKIGNVVEGIRGLEERVLRKEDRLRVLEGRVKCAKEAAVAEEGKLKALREEARAMAEGVGKKRGQKVELESQCGELTGHVRAVTERLSTEKAQLEQVKDEIKAAREDFERVRERVSAAEAKLRLVKEETEQAKGAYRRVKEEVREAKLELSKTRGELTELERRWLGLKLEVTGAKGGVNGLTVKGDVNGAETVGMKAGVNTLSGSDAARERSGVNILDGLRSSLPKLPGSAWRESENGLGRETRCVRSPVAPERPLSHKVSARRPDAVERTSDSDEAKRATTEGAEAQLRVAQNAFRTASDRPQSHKVSAGRSDALKETSESDEGKRATTEGAEAQLRVAQNGLGELLARMHSLQERVARASESDESRDVSGRDVTRGDPLEALAETSLAACLEGVRQVHAQMREACKSVTPGTESERSSATWQQEEPPRGRDVELRALEGVCGEMRADLRKLAERNEALRRVLRCGASGQGGDFAGRSRRGEKEGPACGPTRPCAKCQSLNAKFLEISNEAARLRLLMKTLKARIVELLSGSSDQPQ